MSANLSLVGITLTIFTVDKGTNSESVCVRGLLNVSTSVALIL